MNCQKNAEEMMTTIRIWSEKLTIQYRNKCFKLVWVSLELFGSFFLLSVLRFFFFVYSFRNTETIIHLLKSSLGTGILAMPKAFYHAGYLVGSIGTIVIATILVYGIQTLLASHYELCKRNKVFGFSTFKINFDGFYVWN